MSTDLRASWLVDGDADQPLVVFVPSLGTSVSVLTPVAERIDGVRVLGVDLPGHGLSPAGQGALTVQDLARGVVDAVADVAPGEKFHLAGVSLGGATTLAAALDHSASLLSATPICTAAKIGERDAWQERAAQVRRDGLGVLVDGTRERWFTPEFLASHGDVAEEFVGELHHVDPEGYARCCEALGDFDVRAALPTIQVPLTMVSGGEDQVTTVADGVEIVEAVPNAHFVLLDGIAHQSPAEAPTELARIMSEVVAGRR